MQKNLIALTIISLVLMAGGSDPRQGTLPQPTVVAANLAQGMIPFHCHAPAHAARFFAGSIGVAVGLGGSDNHPQMCLLLRVSQSSANDHANF